MSAEGHVFGPCHGARAELELLEAPRDELSALHPDRLGPASVCMVAFTVTRVRARWPVSGGDGSCGAHPPGRLRMAIVLEVGQPAGRCANVAAVLATGAALCAVLRGPGRADLAGLAARMGMSRGHFQRLFRRVVGLTPAEYGRLAQLAEAKARLSAGDPPAAAAAAAGFADQAHLTRWMRAVYGVTPARVGGRRRGR